MRRLMRQGDTNDDSRDSLNRELSIIDVSSKSKEVCRVQFTRDGLPKLIMSKPIVAHKGDYSALPYNYGNFF
jgi:hypothetical protein